VANVSAGTYVKTYSQYQCTHAPENAEKGQIHMRRFKKRKVSYTLFGLGVTYQAKPFPRSLASKSQAIEFMSASFIGAML